MGFSTVKMSYQVRAVSIATSGTDAWLLTSYRNGSVQVDWVPVKDLEVYATARYLGNAAPSTSIQTTTIPQASGASGNIEPQWSGGGGSSGCQECGRTVKNLD